MLQASDGAPRGGLHSSSPGSFTEAEEAEREQGLW